MPFIHSFGHSCHRFACSTAPPTRPSSLAVATASSKFGNSSANQSVLSVTSPTLYCAVHSDRVWHANHQLTLFRCPPTGHTAQASQEVKYACVHACVLSLSGAFALASQCHLTALIIEKEQINRISYCESRCRTYNLLQPEGARPRRCSRATGYGSWSAAACVPAPC